jgi:hypothetical protein
MRNQTIRIVLAVAAWYFVAYNFSTEAIIQIGPFASEAECSNYRNVVSTGSNYTPLACFSTTAK